MFGHIAAFTSSTFPDAIEACVAAFQSDNVDAQRTAKFEILSELESLKTAADSDFFHDVDRNNGFRQVSVSADATQCWPIWKNYVNNCDR